MRLREHATPPTRRNREADVFVVVVVFCATPRQRRIERLCCRDPDIPINRAE
jgi:hypothetical protein